MVTYCKTLPQHVVDLVMEVYADAIFAWRAYDTPTGGTVVLGIEIANEQHYRVFEKFLFETWEDAEAEVQRLNRLMDIDEEMMVKILISSDFQLSFEVEESLQRKLNSMI